MLGNLASYLLLNPVKRCCCADEAPCQQGGMKNASSEILENGPNVPSSVEVMVEAKDIRGVLPVGPRRCAVSVPTFSTTEDVVLHGRPLYSGDIQHLKMGVAMHEMHLTLYVNGFVMRPREGSKKGGETVIRTWSPFSLLEKCQVRTMQKSDFWAVFKLTVYRQEDEDDIVYFATSGYDAQEERERWINEIGAALSQVITSLFPPHRIAVQPVPWVPVTNTRIMAGYLLQSSIADTAVLVYCELHAYSGGESHMAMYKDEWCEREIATIALAHHSVVSTRRGSYCTVFGVDEHRFCARTREEKECWLRAVSNIKVKLMYEAPDPTDDDLCVFRAAVKERIEGLGRPVASAEPSMPILVQLKRLPDIMSPRGDVLNPEPIDDAAECSPLPAGVECAEEEEERDKASVEGSWTAVGYRAVDALKPEECKQLVKAVSPLVTSTQVPAEDTSINRTVHITGKTLTPNLTAPEDVLWGRLRETAPEEVPSCANNPEEVCVPGCSPLGGVPLRHSQVEPLLRSSPLGGFRSAGELTPKPNVPLLAWSPGRRQFTQHAI